MAVSNHQPSSLDLAENNQPIGSPPVLPPDFPTSPKKRRIWIFLSILIVIVILAGIAFGAYLITVQKNITNITNNSVDSITVLSQAVPMVNCKDFINKVNIDPSKEACYSKLFNTNIGQVTFVANGYSEAQIQQQKLNCQVDCGGNIYSTELEGYIIIPNGQVLKAPIQPEGIFALDTQSDYTGCHSDKMNNFIGRGGEFEITNNTVGVIGQVANEEITDRFGNKCIVSYTWRYSPTSDSTTQNPDKLSNLTVKYVVVQPETTCNAQKDLFSKNRCLSALAVIKNDLKICDLVNEPSGTQGNSECVRAMAVRRKDKALCNTMKQSTFEYIQNCIKYVEDYGDTLVGIVTVL